MMNVKKQSFPTGYNKYNVELLNKSLRRNQPLRTQIRANPNIYNVNYNVNNARRVVPTYKNKKNKRVRFGSLNVINVESYKEYTLRDTYEADKIMQNMIAYAQERERIRCCTSQSAYGDGENVRYCCVIF